jgi:hypothetical protein
MPEPVALTLIERPLQEPVTLTLIERPLQDEEVVQVGDLDKLLEIAMCACAASDSQPY